MISLLALLNFDSTRNTCQKITQAENVSRATTPTLIAMVGSVGLGFLYRHFLRN
jgi:hypothetical protein